MITLATAIIYSKNTYADEPTIVYVSGTLENDQTWSPGNIYVVTNTLTIPDNVDLIVQAGTIIKYPTTAWYSNGLQVSPGGSVTIAGTSIAPVTFTSMKDDSVGGDTASDGPTVGTAGDYVRALGTNGGVIEVDHAILKYADVAIDTSSVATLSVQDSNFKDCSGYGVHVYGNANISIERNHFDVSGEAIQVSGADNISGISLLGANSNSFSGTAVNRTVEVKDSGLPFASVWDISSSTGAVVKTNGFTVDGGLTVKSGAVLVMEGGHSQQSITLNGVLSLEPGAIIKNRQSIGVMMHPDSVLDARGTALNPIYFTSYQDDARGGDSTSNGAGPVAIGDYVNMFTINGGEAVIEHASFQYADKTIHTNGASVDMTIRDSVFTEGYSGISADGGELILERNTFDLSGQQYYYPAIELRNINDLSGVALAGPNKNIFSGATVHSRTLILDASAVPLSKTWTISNESGVMPKFLHDVDFVGDVSFGNDLQVIFSYGQAWTPSILVHGSLDIGSGVIVKGKTNIGIAIEYGGSIALTGTSLKPVIFTSYLDDGVGGDANGDGTTTSASRNDYARALHFKTNTTGSADYTYFMYGSEAFILNGMTEMQNLNVHDVDQVVTVDGGEHNMGGVISNADKVADVIAGDLTLRATLDNITGSKIITACSWGGECAVDAAYTDWDSTNPIDEELVCGTVTVSPWKIANSPVSGAPFAIPNCNSSATPLAILLQNADSFDEMMEQLGVNCGYAIQEACDNAEERLACTETAMSIVSANSPVPLPGGSPASNAADYSQLAANSLGDFLMDSELAVVTGTSLMIAGELTGTLETILAMNNAYTTCFGA